MRKCSRTDNQNNVEDFKYVEVPLKGKAMKNIDPSDKSHIMLYQDSTNMTEKIDEYVGMHVILPRGEVYQRSVLFHLK